MKNVLSRIRDIVESVEEPELKVKDLLNKVTISEILQSLNAYDSIFLPTEKILSRTKVKPSDYAIMNGAIPMPNSIWDRWIFYESSKDKTNLSNIYYDTTKSIAPVIALDTSVVISYIKKSIDFKIEPDLDNNFSSSQISKMSDYTMELGYFPQDIASNSDELERLFKKGLITATGRSYVGYLDDKNTIVQNLEYIYKGVRYVRVSLPTSVLDNKQFYIDKPNFYNKKELWAKVQPIKWYIVNWDNLPKEINPYGKNYDKIILAISTSSLIGGVPYVVKNNVTKNKDLIWQNCLIRALLNGYNIYEELSNGNGNFDYRAQINFDFKGNGFYDQVFLDSLNKSADLTNQEEINENDVIYDDGEFLTTKTRLERLNPDKTPKLQRRLMTDTEIIKSWIDSGESVLLRGPSGIGKTERIKKCYPNLIYIKLTNNMFPEKVVGSVNLQTGQLIPPDFAKEAIMACANEKEKKLIKENIQNLYEFADIIYERSKNRDDKIVILLDELLNVKPAVQSLVYSLVLNKMVESGKGLKLPNNVVVVATGNQKKYSSVAEDLVEPLEKRFDHILDMEPKVNEWLVEYAIPNKLHSTVIGYILTKYIESGKSEDRNKIGYFYEEPEVGELHLDKNGCRGRTNDPRGWASISKMLYNFEEDLKSGKFIGKDVESLLETTINSKLRTEWAAEFLDYYNCPTISIEDIVKKQYKATDLPTNINEKFAVLAGLLNANDKEFNACRKFIEEYCSPEYVKIYDMYWAGNDENRIEKVAELEEMSMFDSITKGKNQEKVK